MFLAKAALRPLLVSFFALAGCGGIVVEKVSKDSGAGDTSTIVEDTAVVDSGPPVRDTSTPDTSPPPPSGEGCSACVNSHCKAEVDACQASSACLSVADCFNACADDTCRNACLSPDTKGVALFSAVLECAQEKCGSECGL